VAAWARDFSIVPTLLGVPALCALLDSASPDTRPAGGSNVPEGSTPSPGLNFESVLALLAHLALRVFMPKQAEQKPPESEASIEGGDSAFEPRDAVIELLRRMDSSRGKDLLEHGHGGIGTGVCAPLVLQNFDLRRRKKKKK
jgi:hypothetical protein